MANLYPRCDDCKASTDGEHYLVHDAVWFEACPNPSAWLCLGCLETRLERWLVPSDFQPVNLNFNPLVEDRSHRFQNRVGLDELPVQNDPEVFDALYTFFPFLKDYPLDLNGSFIDDARCLGRLQRPDLLGFVMAYELEREPYPSDFPFLTPEQNRQLCCYRDLRPVLPYPQPVINLVQRADGQLVTGETRKVTVVLKNAGSAQVWFGGGTAVLWEAFFDRQLQARGDHAVLMTQLWDLCEGYLQKQGVKQVYTYASDPEFPDDWYRPWLEARGYVLAENEPRPAMCKRLGGA